MSWAEIIGFHLVDAVTGKVVGTIDHVDDSTLNLLFEVTTPMQVMKSSSLPATTSSKR